MNWIILTIASAFFASSVQVLQRKLLKSKNSDPIAYSFVFQLIVAVLFLLYALATGTFEQPDITSVGLNVTLMSALYGLGSIFLFYAYKYSEASEVSIIFSTSAVWSTLTAVIFLGDKIKADQILGMGLIVLGMILVNLKKTKWQIGKGHLFGLLGAIMFGVAFVNDAYILGLYTSIPSYMVIAFALPALVSIIIKPSAIKSIPSFFEYKTLTKVIICSVMYSLAAMTVFSAIKIGGQPSIVNMLRQSGLVFTVLLSYFTLDEKDNMRNKWISVILAIFGGILLI